MQRIGATYKMALVVLVTSFVCANNARSVVVQLPPSKSASKLDATDSGPHLVQTNLPVVTPDWLAKVQSLQGRAAAGTLPVQASLVSAVAPKSAIPWPASDALVLERNQTWWTEGGEWSYVHIANEAAHELGALAMDLGPNRCGHNDLMSRFHLYINPPILPGTEALVQFRLPPGASSRGCLDITGAWRALW